MKSAAKRTFSLLTSAALLLAAVLIYSFFIRPSYDDIVQLRSLLNSKSLFLQEQNVAAGKVNELIMQYRGTGKLQDTISLSFPLKEDLSSVFNQLRAIAEINNLRIEIFGVKPLAFRPVIQGPLARELGTLQVSLKLSGPYESLKGFLRGLETNVRIMDAQSYSIERAASPIPNFFTYNLTVNTYYQGKK